MSLTLCSGWPHQPMMLPEVSSGDYTLRSHPLKGCSFSSQEDSLQPPTPSVYQLHEARRRGPG